MRICVVGSGAVGGYYGAKMARAGHDVVFAARGAHLAAMRARGLTVKGTLGEFRVKGQFEEHWTKDLDAWFKEGIDTPGLVLVKVHAERLHYWDGWDEGEIDPGQGVRSDRSVDA